MVAEQKLHMLALTQTFTGFWDALRQILNPKGWTVANQKVQISPSRVSHIEYIPVIKCTGFLTMLSFTVLTFRQARDGKGVLDQW